MVRLAFFTLTGLFSRFRLRHNVVAMAVAGLVSLACTHPVDPVAVTAVNVQPSVDSVELGSSLSHFVATALDAQGTEVKGRKVTWRTVNPAIATVDPSGTLTGVAIGNTRLVALVEGRPSNQVLITVISKATRILAVPDSVDIPLGTSKNLNAAVFDASGSAISGRTVTWTSADPLIAAVVPGGQVSAISIGETTVTATVRDLHAVVKVRVVPERVASVRIIDPVGGSYILRVTKSVQVTAVALNGQQVVLPGRTMAWSSSNPAVASVNPTTGLVTGNTLGNANITVFCEGLTDNIQIQVTQIPVASVSILPTDPTLFVGQNTQLVAIVKDSAGNTLSTVGRNVNWLSSNLTVANVNSNGVLNAIAAGTSTVTVLVEQVASPPITVTVNQKPVVSVVVNPQAQTIKVGFTFQLQAILRDIDGNTLGSRPTTWVSADPTIATVSANGLVQGVAVGTVKITATSEGVSGDATITIIP